MDQLNNTAQLEKAVSHVTKVIESAVDKQIEKIDSDISHLNDVDDDATAKSLGGALCFVFLDSDISHLNDDVASRRRL